MRRRVDTGEHNANYIKEVTNNRNYIHMLTQSELKVAKANLAKIQNEPKRTEKLSALLENVTELARLTPYVQQHREMASKQDMMDLEKEVRSAHTASLIRNGETDEYSRYRANADRGIDRHPDAKHNTHAEIMAQLRSSPELRELARGLGGLTKEQLRQELPE
jgi:hypothetical protein